MQARVAPPRSRRLSSESSTSNNSWQLASEHMSWKSMDAQHDRLDTEFTSEPYGRVLLQRSFSFHALSGLRDRYLTGGKPHSHNHLEDSWEIESLNLSRLSTHQKRTISCLWAAKLAYYFALGMQPMALPPFVEGQLFQSAATGTLFATLGIATIVFWPIWKMALNLKKKSRHWRCSKFVHRSDAWCLGTSSGFRRRKNLWLLSTGNKLSKIGTKNMLMTGTFLTGLSFLLFGFLHFEESWLRFIVIAYLVKVIEGAGLAALEIAVTLKTMVEFPRHESGAYGSAQTCTGIGVAIGAGIGGFLYSLKDIASSFITCGILLLAVGLVVMCLLEKRPYINPTLTDSRKRRRRFFRESSVHSAIFMFFFGVVAISSLFPILEPHLREVFVLNFVVEGIVIAVIPLGFIFGKLFWQWLITHDYVCGLDCVNIFGLIVFGITFFFLGPFKALKIPNNLLWLHVLLFLFIGGAMSMVYAASLSALLETAELKKLNKLSAYSTITTMLIVTLCIGIPVGACLGGYLNQEYGFAFTTAIIAVISLIVAGLDSIYAVIRTAIRLKNYNQMAAEIQQRKKLTRQASRQSRAPLIGGSRAQITKTTERYYLREPTDRKPLLDSPKAKPRTYGTYL